MKTCTKCKTEKPFEAFYKSKYTKDGYWTECIECRKEKYRELKKNPLMQLEKQIRSSVILENKLLAKEGKKLCSKCKDIFLIDDLFNGKRCKNCDMEYAKEYKEKNKDKRNEYHREYREKNKDKRNEQSKEYWLKNKDKLKEYNKKYRLKKKLEKELKG